MVHVRTRTPNPPALFKGYVALGSKIGPLRTGRMLGTNLLSILRFIY
jgi:hypothetical protein